MSPPHFSQPCSPQQPVELYVDGTAALLVTLTRLVHLAEVLAQAGKLGAGHFPAFQNGSKNGQGRSCSRS
jgi:hypothetical protein